MLRGMTEYNYYAATEQMDLLMVLVRCEEHRPDLDDDDEPWIGAVEPVGYPETAVLCGYRTHTDPEPGLVFLSAEEYKAYQLGKRIFSPVGTATQIKVVDTLVGDPESSDDGISPVDT